MYGICAENVEIQPFHWLACINKACYTYYQSNIIY